MLKLPDLSKLFVLITDESRIGVAADAGEHGNAVLSGLSQQEIKSSRGKVSHYRVGVPGISVGYWTLRTVPGIIEVHTTD